MVTAPSLWASTPIRCPFWPGTPLPSSTHSGGIATRCSDTRWAALSLKGWPAPIQLGFLASFSWTPATGRSRVSIPSRSVWRRQLRSSQASTPWLTSWQRSTRRLILQPIDAFSKTVRDTRSSRIANSARRLPTSMRASCRSSCLARTHSQASQEWTRNHRRWCSSVSRTLLSLDRRNAWPEFFPNQLWPSSPTPVTARNSRTQMLGGRPFRHFWSRSASPSAGSNPEGDRGRARHAVRWDSSDLVGLGGSEAHFARTPN